jgi:hypothetical protein
LNIRYTENSAVDVVYLWVNGNDDLWRSKRHAAAQTAHPQAAQDLAIYGDVEGRYRDNEELRFSLRALEKFFPEHGHIYIVTDNQVPAWLAALDQVTIVDHRELIPAQSLPTFDSGHIESYIHRIPGLSERFFYFNDDVFFGAPVKLDDWFWSGGVYVAWSDDPVVSNEPLRRDATSLENACRLSDQWMQANSSPSRDLAYQHTYRTFAHAPRPMRKSMLLELEVVAPDLFERVRSTVFRSWDCPTIISDFVLRWALAQGVAKVREYPHAYVSTGDANADTQLTRLSQAFGELAFFCINDTTDNAQADDPRLSQLRQALQGMLPDASVFEASGQWLETPQHLALAVDQFQNTFVDAG